jgi:hypothetical protein
MRNQIDACEEGIKSREAKNTSPIGKPNFVRVIASILSFRVADGEKSRVSLYVAQEEVAMRRVSRHRLIWNFSRVCVVYR